jgi:hypothetical protein
VLVENILPNVAVLTPSFSCPKRRAKLPGSDALKQVPSGRRQLSKLIPTRGVETRQSSERAFAGVRIQSCRAGGVENATTSRTKSGSKYIQPPQANE